MKASYLHRLHLDAAIQGKSAKIIIRFANGIEVEGIVRRYT